MLLAEGQEDGFLDKENLEFFDEKEDLCYIMHRSDQG